MEALYFGNKARKNHVLASCNICSNKFVTTNDARKCIFCASTIRKKRMESVSLEGSVNNLYTYKCLDCEKLLSNELNNVEDDYYCPLCGGGIEEQEKSEEESKEESEEEKEEQEETKEKPKEEEKEEKEESEEEEKSEEQEKSEQEPKEEEEKPEEIKEKLQGFCVNNSWVFFEGSDPVFRIDKEKVRKDFHPIFAEQSFYDLVSDFYSNSKSDCISAFNADTFDSSLTNVIDLQTMAFNKFKAEILPRIIECHALAVKGSVNGFFNMDSLFKEFATELSSSGIPIVEAENIVKNVIKAHGEELFTAFMTKALELFNKDKSAYNEIQSMVTNTKVNYSDQDIESRIISKKLTEGNFPYNTDNIIAQSVEQTKKKLKFRRY